MSKIKSAPVIVRTMYGSMEFASYEAVEQFRKVIASWEGFTAETRPQSGFEAVQYHLAYETGGFAEVYSHIRHLRVMGALETARIRHVEEVKLQKAQAFAERVFQFRQEELGYL